MEGVGDPVTSGISGILLSLLKSPPLVSANSIVKNLIFGVISVCVFPYVLNRFLMVHPTDGRSRTHRDEDCSNVISCLLNPALLSALCRCFRTGLLSDVPTSTELSPSIRYTQYILQSMLDTKRKKRACMHARERKIIDFFSFHEKVHQFLGDFCCCCRQMAAAAAEKKRFRSLRRRTGAT